jgi:nicotinamidase-related amidase
MTNPIYAEPSNPALPDSGFELDLRHAALVVTDPQIDFLSPDGVTWAVFGDSIQENGTVAHIGELFDAAKAAGITVAVSPHYFYPPTQWKFGDPLRSSDGVNIFGRRGLHTLDGLPARATSSPTTRITSRRLDRDHLATQDRRLIE